jgi:hypothetical protein
MDRAVRTDDRAPHQTGNTEIVQPVFSGMSEDFIRNWTQSRIEQPLKLMSHHDDAARQLIAMSAFLQAVYLGVFTFSKVNERLRPGTAAILIVLLIVPLIAVVFSSAKVLCAIPKNMNVHGTFRLIASAATAETALRELDRDIHCWCDEIDRVARRKTRWLRWANIFFMVASAVTAALLVAIAMMCR